MDLLGYGSMLRDVEFNPRRKESQNAIERLFRFHGEISHHVHEKFPAMIMNDGVAFFRDLSARTRHVGFDFLERAIGVHQRVNEIDVADGYFGARMVIAAGMRVRSLEGPIYAERHLESILKRVENNRISANQAIYEAFKSRLLGGFVPQLQANFAFTRAYLADSSGSKAGLSGPRCFVDMDCFGGICPSWITFSELIPWEVKGMKTEFGIFKQADWEAGNASSHSGILDSIDLIKHLETN